MTLTLVAGMVGAVCAEAAQPNQKTLTDMGLGGLVVMSDDDAMAIRGMGFKGGSSAKAWGISFANVSTKFGSAGSVNGYHAEGKHFAKGSNLSFAGFELEIERENGGKGGHGGWTGGRKGKKGGKWGGKGGGKWGGKGGGKGGKGGHGGGHHGGGNIEISFKVFAGGNSFAKAK